MGLKDILDEFHGRTPAPPAAPAMPVGPPIGDLDDAFWVYLRRLGEVEAAEANPDLDEHHPSQAYQFCPRQRVLAHFFPHPEVTEVSPELRLTFGWGTAWHQHVQDHYYGPMGILLGGWRCVGCGRIVTDAFLPPPCDACHTADEIARWQARPIKANSGWMYREPKLRDPEFGIVGRCDGFLRMTPWNPASPRALLEVKTINGAGFTRLMRPHDSHLFQAQVYMGLSDVPVTWFAYYSKETKPADSRPRVFRVSYDGGEALEEFRRRIRLWRRVWPAKQLCAGICESLVDPRAKYCPNAQECFHDDVEAAVEKRRAGSA